MVKRFGLAGLVLVLLLACLDFRDEIRTDAAPAPTAGPAIRPLTAGALFDVEDMARRALAQHWKALGPREHEEFVRLFGQVLASSFATILQRYSGDDIAYRLSQHGARWMVYDVVVDGVSLVSSYRSQFNSIIVTSSVAELLERMRTEPSRRDVETPAPERLAAGLVLRASHARWR